MAWEYIKKIFGPESAPAEEFVYLPPRPRLVAVQTAPSRDAFDAWRDEPVTQFVFAALRNMAAEQKEAWLEISWHGAEANEKLLTELRTRADAFDALEASSYFDFCAGAGVEPENDNAAA